MRYCTNCGNTIPDGASFCGVCGSPAAVSQDQYAYEEEKAFLDYTHRFLRYERLAWKISGVVFLILSLAFLGIGILFIMLGMLSGAYGGVDTFYRATSLSVSVVMGAYWMIFGILYLPIAVINIKMVKKVEGYMSGLYTDVRAAATRNASVGMIVFSAIFNTIAMVFYIINFSNTKGKRVVIERIICRQRVSD